MKKKTEDEYIEEENLNYDELQQMRHASKIMDNVNFNIYNNENLSNGDKVKVQLKLEKGTSKQFKLKAKEFTKEFKCCFEIKFDHKHLKSPFFTANKKNPF